MVGLATVLPHICSHTFLKEVYVMAGKGKGPDTRVQGNIPTPKIPGSQDLAAKGSVFMSHGGAKGGKGGKC